MAEWTGGYSAFYDVTRPEVMTLLQEHLAQLRNQYGVDGFLFDCAGALPYLQFAKGGARDFLLRWSELSGDCNFCQYIGQPVGVSLHGDWIARIEIGRSG